jgi:hypothetical protein
MDVIEARRDLGAIHACKTTLTPASSWLNLKGNKNKHKIYRHSVNSVTEGFCEWLTVRGIGYGNFGRRNIG